MDIGRREVRRRVSYGFRLGVVVCSIVGAVRRKVGIDWCIERKLD